MTQTIKWLDWGSIHSVTFSHSHTYVPVHTYIHIHMCTTHTHAYTSCDMATILSFSLYVYQYTVTRFAKTVYFATLTFYVAVKPVM